MADGLRYDLEPLSASDIADGMEPLSLEDVQGTLNEIARRITFFAMQELRATQDEWMRASDSIA
ncbi:MAG: hypothetical protein ACR2PC_07770 [Tsuneonella suprasediminis]|nr:hypothetical protein LBX01_07060 [Altererythrobacter sp. N1]